MKTLITIILVVLTFSLHAQLSYGNLQDSIEYYKKVDKKITYRYAKEAYQKSITDNNECKKFRFLNDITYCDEIIGIDSALLLSFQLQKKVYESDCQASLKQRILLNYTWLLRNSGNYKRAIEFCDIGLARFQNDSIFNFHIHNNLGAIQSQIGNHEKAVNHFLSALDIATIKIPKHRAIILNNICTVYNDNGFPMKAKQYCQKSRSLAMKESNDYAFSLSTNTLGCIYNDLNMRDSARIFINEVLSKPLPQYVRHYSYLELGRIEEFDNNYDLSIANYKKAVEIAKQLNYPFEEAFSRSSLGNIYLLKQDYQVALIHSKLSLDIYSTLESTPQELVDVYQRHLLALSGSKKLIPLPFLEKYFQLHDSVFNENKRTLLVEIEEKYQNDVLKTVADYNQAIISSQNKQIMGFAAGSLILGILTYFLFSQNKKKQKLNKNLKNQRDQIKILNQELNHRVKNNLAFMTSLLEMQSRRSTQLETKSILTESKNRLKALSLVHKSLFTNSSDSEIHLDDYLNEITSYLKDVFENPYKNLVINTNYARYKIDAEDAMRFGLIINELVTNSVKHAFLEVDNAYINIRTYLNYKNVLVLEYKDNGPGIERRSISDSTESSLGNKLIELLKIQLGERYIFITL